MSVTRKRMQTFVYYYTLLCSETHGNPYKAARKAGYSESYSKVDVYRLLERPYIKEMIDNIEREQRRLAQISIEDKQSIALDNYQRCMNNKQIREAREWFKEHGLLSGHYVQKQEIKQTIMSKEQEKELTELKNALILRNRLSEKDLERVSS